MRPATQDQDRHPEVDVIRCSQGLLSASLIAGVSCHYRFDGAKSELRGMLDVTSFFEIVAYSRPAAV
jgi:hypothetical protein